MIPVIALVGRPNVGKSTLFNVLTRTRDALISDFPGLTRDRQYGHAIVKEHEFIVIDTGGIQDNNNVKGIEKIILEQSLLAIKEADIILLIVDARSGIMPADYLITNYLRLYNKKIFLVINKIDDLDACTAALDFYQLGLDEIYSITASHGRGISSLFKNGLLPYFNSHKIKNEESKVFSSIIKKKNCNLNIPIKIAIVGRPNVGKSTFINHILDEDRVIVYDVPGTTRNSLYIPMEYAGQEYILIDTAGIRKRGKIIDQVEKLSIIKTLQSIKEANVVILIIDACIGISDQDMSLLGFIITSQRPIVIFINKWDKISQQNKRKFKENLNFRLNFINFVRIHFISALYINRATTDNLFKSITEAYDCSNKRINTATLTQIMLMAVNEHQPPLACGRRIKLKYAHAGKYNPLVVIIHGNQLNKLPDSYKRYLMNYFRRSLNIIGTLVYIQFKETVNPYVNKLNFVKNKQLKYNTKKKFRKKVYKDKK